MAIDPAEYPIQTAHSLREALTFLDSKDEVWTPFAGGTDLMVKLQAGAVPPQNFISIFHLPELKGIRVTPGYVTLGAATTFSEIRRSAILRKEFAMVCWAAELTGGIAIQNRGTIGGNIVNASPAADTPPALICYDAEVELTALTGSRWFPIKDFQVGYKQSCMQRNELLTKIRLPRSGKNFTEHYQKVGARKAMAIAKVCFAARAVVRKKRIEDIRIALGSVAPITLRAIDTEKKLTGARLNTRVIDQAVDTLLTEIHPIDDIRSTKAYRSRVSVNILRHFLENI